MGSQSGRYAEDIQRHRAPADDVRMLDLVKRKHKGETVHKEDTQHSRGHPSKSGKIHMRSLQSHIECRSQHRDVHPPIEQQIWKRNTDLVTQLLSSIDIASIAGFQMNTEVRNAQAHATTKAHRMQSGPWQKTYDDIKRK